MEHDPIAFRREQETVAQLIHQVSSGRSGTDQVCSLHIGIRLPGQVRHEDPTKVIEVLFVLWEYFREVGSLGWMWESNITSTSQGGPHRIIFSVPAMVSASLELVCSLRGVAESAFHASDGVICCVLVSSVVSPRLIV